MYMFMGLMLPEDVELEKTYVDENNGDILIQAGKIGWNIVYPDYSTEHEENDATSEENFDLAYKQVTENNLYKITEVTDNERFGTIILAVHDTFNDEESELEQDAFDGTSDGLKSLKD